METIKLDLIPRGILPVCYVSQFDVSRKIGISIMENGNPFNLQADDVVEFNERKPDGNLVTCFLTAVASSPSVTLETSEQMTACPGINKCQLKITRNEQVLGTINFMMIVEDDPTNRGIESHSEIKTLATQVKQIVDDDMEAYEETFNAALEGKANVSDVYDKTYMDGIFEQIDNAFTGVDNALNGKADKSNTYTKAEVNDALVLKANASDVYSKEDTYNKTELNKKFAQIDDSLYKAVAINLASGVDLTSGKAVDYSNGSLRTSTAFSASDYIDISSFSQIVYTKLFSTSSTTPQTGMAFYDAEKTYISGIRIGYNAATPHYEYETLDVPSGAKYARFTVNEALSTPFEVFDKVQLNNSDQIKVETLEKKSQNFKVLIPEMYSDPIWSENTVINYSTGAVQSGSLRSTDYINIDGSTDIIYSRVYTTSSTAVHGIAFYDAEKTYISGVRSSINSANNYAAMYTTPVPSGAKYVRLTYFKADSPSMNIPFGVYDASQYNNSLLIRFNTFVGSVERESEAMGLHTMPESRGVLNLIKRCRQLTDIEWTPAVDLPRLMRETLTQPTDSDYAANMSTIYLGKFSAGKKYKGIPYGRCDDLGAYGYSNSYVGLHIDLETFITAVSNPQSYVSLESSGNVLDHQSIVFAAVCSALTCYALNVSYKPTSNIPTIDGLQFITELTVDGEYISPNTFKLGDVLNLQGDHTVMITDLVKDDNGNVIYIEESEATMQGNGNKDVEGGETGGLCRRVGYSVSEFFDRFGGYQLLRYDYIDAIPYTPSKYVNVGDELDMARLIDLPVMPYMGEGFKYKSGYIPNTTLAINSTYYNKLRVFKDGTEIASSPFTVSPGDVSVDVGFSDAGNYEAYLCKMSGGSNTAVSAKCHWSVV